MPRPHNSASLTGRIESGYVRKRLAQVPVRWFVAYCNPGCEKRAALCLEARGYETFLPLRTRWEKQFKRRVKVDRALFPRYLFVGLKPGQDFWGFRNAHGVESILRNHDVPVEAPRSAIEELAHACATGAFDDTAIAAGEPPYRPGDAVEVVAGPFASLSATFERVLSSETAEILVGLFGRQFPVRVPLDSLRMAC